MECAVINLCYEAGKYTFILPLTQSEIDQLRTRKLLGAHLIQMKCEILIVETQHIALYQRDLHRMYNIPNAGFRIHLNVPIAPGVMEYICPTQEELNLIIYFE